MSSKITIHNKDSENIYPNAAELLIKSLKSHQKEKILILLSGGSVVKVYKVMSYELSVISSEKMAIAQVDERFFGKEQRTENKKQINADQIGRVGLWEMCRKRKIPYYLVSQEGKLTESAEEYDQTISKLFKEYTYKIAVLGIGEDGHTAGLLPGYEKAWNTDKLVTGYENNGEFRQRISLTPDALSQLDYGIVVAIGEKKRRAIETALDPINQKYLDKYPAAILQKMKEVDLFTDIKLV